MKTAARDSFAEYLGRTLGRQWRLLMRLDLKTNGWLAAQGVAPGIAKVALLLAKLAALGLLLYAAFWLAVVIMLAVLVTWTAANSAHNDPEEWAIGSQADHKRSIFYDPINYNDDPDPRFDGER